MITDKVHVLGLVTTKLDIRALLCAVITWTLRGEGGNNHIKELIKEPRKKSKFEKVKTQSKEPILLR
jgi:hypothetical protein